MSLFRHILNPWLRLTEKRHLARATPEKMRSAFEWKATLFFRPPRGTRYGQTELIHDGRSLTAVTVNADAPGPLILYFHGGGYVFGSPDTHKAMLAKLSELTGLPVCLPRYRLAPEHPFPAAPEDALTAYRAVMDHPGGIVLGGDSAGGGLALSLLAEITRLKLPQPLGTFAFSPLTDLTFTAPSLSANARADVVLPASRTAEMAEMFLQDADPRDPRSSPLFADFTWAGPVWLVVGDGEILLDDTLRMADRLDAQGISVTYDVLHDLPHVWPIFHNMLPEGRATLRALARWITALSPRSGDS